MHQNAKSSPTRRGKEHPHLDSSNRRLLVVTPETLLSLVPPQLLLNDLDQGWDGGPSPQGLVVTCAWRHLNKPHVGAAHVFDMGGWPGLK